MELSLEKLEQVYNTYNKFKYIHPDPLEFLYEYNDASDIEIVGLISSCLAYGNVKQILKSISIVLSKLKPTPYEYITGNNIKTFAKDFAGFKHRFTTDIDKVNLLTGIKNVLDEYGSLKECFSAGYSNCQKNLLPAAAHFTKTLNKYCKNSKSYLLPSPEAGSACKRLMLYLRWMVRKDDVDPGSWHDIIPNSKLIMPLDTHIYQISLMFGFTKRKSADMKTAIEITEKFRKINPDDPTKYDFALSRFGIRDELTYNNI